MTTTSFWCGLSVLSRRGTVKKITQTVKRISCEDHASRFERRNESDHRNKSRPNALSQADIYHRDSPSVTLEFSFTAHSFDNNNLSDATVPHVAGESREGRRCDSMTISEHASRCNATGHVTVHRLHGRAHPFVIGRQLTGNGSLVAHAPTSQEDLLPRTCSGRRLCRGSMTSPVAVCCACDAGSLARDGMATDVWEFRPSDSCCSLQIELSAGLQKSTELRIVASNGVHLYVV